MMNDVAYVLDFAVNLGCRMLVAGANLERVNDTMTRICLSYHLEFISIYSLSGTIMVSAKSADGVYASRHIAVQPASIHLENLNQLNRLSRTVCTETPVLSSLAALLDQTQPTEEYSISKIILGYMIAMTSLCVIFGGTVKDVIAADCITFVLFWLIRWLSDRNLNRIVVNTLCMWFSGTFGLLLVRFGIGDQYFIIIITSSMMMIPGDMLYNTAVNLILQNTPKMLDNAQNCALSLAGMSIGFVLISTFAYYRRIYYVGTDMASHLLRRQKKNFRKSE